MARATRWALQGELRFTNDVNIVTVITEQETKLI